jgi:hypothetical protein
MAHATNSALATLLCLLVVTACAEGTPPLTDNDQLTDGNAGSTSGAGGEQAQGGSSAVAGANANAGGAQTTGGAASAGSSSGGASGSAQTMGGAAGSATAGASSMAGSSMGGNASAGSAGKGGSSTGGTSGAANGGASAGSGGSAAACTGTKPESNCVCHTNNAHDYWFCPTARTFADGESKCVGAGLHMVKIASAAEDKWVNDTANAATFGEYYLGSTDATTQNTWTWLAGGTFWTGVANGSASGYSHWNTGEPNASGDCLVVQSNFVWDDRICTDNRTYICD